MDEILLVSGNVATLGLLEIKVFWNKGYDIRNKILSRDSNYITDVVKWPKFGSSNIAMREVTITSVL